MRNTPRNTGRNVGRRTVTVPVKNSAFITEVKHNGRGVLRVSTNEGKTLRYRAPIEVADQAAALASQGRSVGRWFNYCVRNVFPYMGSAGRQR